MRNFLLSNYNFFSSVQLLGDLLYRISGVTGKMSTETASEDDNFGTEQSHYAIINSLGEERRNRVLAGLYMGRSDVALMVRQAALHVWKVVVTNTPRTLREILPTLFGLLLGEKKYFFVTQTKCHSSNIKSHLKEIHSRFFIVFAHV